MKIVNVNGVTYLATLSKTENGDIVLENAMEVGGANVSQGVITEYYKRGNVGTLKTVNFGGAGISYSVSDLDDSAVMFCKIADLAIAQAKKTAIKNLENREFDGVLGKL